MFRILFIPCFLILCSCDVFAGETDSLLALLKTAKQDSVRCRLLQDLSNTETDNTKWPAYNDSCLAIAQRNLRRYAKNTTAWRTFRLYEANAINNVGYLASHRGNVSLSIEKMQEALTIYEELGIEAQKANAYNNIAYVYMNQNQNDKALEFYRKSYAIFKKSGDEKTLAIVINNIGIVHNNKGQTDSALYYYQQSLKLREKIGNVNSIATALNNIGNLYKKMGRYDDAIATLEKAAALIANSGDMDNRGNCLNNIGVCYLSKKEYRKALSYSEPAHRIAVKLGYPVLLQRTSGALKEIYKNLGQYEKAFAMAELNKQMSDSINKKEFREAVIRDEYRFEYGRKAAADSMKRAAEKLIEAEQLAASEERVAQAKKQRYTLYGGLLLVILFSVFLLNRFLLIQKQKKIIEQQKSLVEEKNRDIVDSINYAKNIQEAILPSETYIKSLLPDSFVVYKPKDIVSGDFYFAGAPVTNSGVRLIVVGVGDCTGHGVPGAFLTLLGKTFLQLGLEEPTVNSAADALDYLNKGLSDMLNKTMKGDTAVRDGMDISLCAIDLTNMLLDFAGAKNPVCIIRNGTAIELKADKHAIGELDEQNLLKAYTSQQFRLEKGDCIYMFTDGYADQFGGEKGKKFKYRQLIELYTQVAALSAPEQEKTIEATFEKWKGNLEQVDDVCIVGFRV